MKSYHRTEVMREGKFFRCYNCNKVLASHYSGDRFTLILTCPRCKAITTVKVGEVAPHALEDENLTRVCLESLIRVLRKEKLKTLLEETLGKVGNEEE